MTKREERILWMTDWCLRQPEGPTLQLAGECGLGRECVGVLVNGHYPSYHWYNEDFTQIDNNGEVWTPNNAYHKYPCIAVLGRGDDAEQQLYEWLKWFDDNKFIIELVATGTTDPIELMMNGGLESRIVKRTTIQ